MKHMELLTNAIARMSNTSVLVKGWGMTLVVGLLALAAKDSERAVMAVAFLPIAVLGLLDAYYLLIERGLRARFTKVSNTREAEIDFDMSPVYSNAPFRDYGWALCSVSVWPFWLMLAASTRLMIWFIG